MEKRHLQKPVQKEKSSGYEYLITNANMVFVHTKIIFLKASRWENVTVHSSLHSSRKDIRKTKCNKNALQ